MQNTKIAKTTPSTRLILNRPLKTTVADSKTKETMVAQVEIDPLVVFLVNKRHTLDSKALTSATRTTSHSQDYQSLVI